MIYVDSLEPASMKSFFPDATFTRLECGDYAVGEYVIERKLLGDFIASVLDGRLHSQRYRLINCGCKPIIVVIGIRDFSSYDHISADAIVTAIADLASHGITVINLASDAEFIHFINKLEEKYPVPWKPEIYIPDAPDLNTRLWMCIKKISYNRAQILSEKFSFFDILQLEMTDISQLKGFGKALAETILKVPQECDRENKT